MNCKTNFSGTYWEWSLLFGLAQTSPLDEVHYRKVKMLDAFTSRLPDVSNMAVFGVNEVQKPLQSMGTVLNFGS